MGKVLCISCAVKVTKTNWDEANAKGTASVIWTDLGEQQEGICTLIFNMFWDKLSKRNREKFCLPTYININRKVHRIEGTYSEYVQKKPVFSFIDRLLRHKEVTKAIDEWRSKYLVRSFMSSLPRNATIQPEIFAEGDTVQLELVVKRIMKFWFENIKTFDKELFDKLSRG